MDTKDIAVNAQVLLGFVNALLPILENAGVGAGPYGAAVTAGLALLIPIINQLHLSGNLSAEEQTALLNRVSNILSGIAFQKEHWKVSTLSQ